MDQEEEVNSDEELLLLSKDFGHDRFYDSMNLVTEFTKFGIFKCDDEDLDRSELYLELLSTLRHLSDSFTSHEYTRHLFEKDKTQLSKNVNFSRSDRDDDSMKHFEVLVHSSPCHLIGKCTLREIDGPVGAVNKDNLSVKTVNSVVVSADVLQVIPSLGFRLSKKHRVRSQVFHVNYGSVSYVQVSLCKYEEVSPGKLLVEIKCFGNSELEFYKNRINTFAKLLYKYLSF